MEPTNNNQAIFSQLEFREILLTFLYKIINGEYKNPQHLKRAIKKAYKNNGITENQEGGLLMSLDLEGEPKGTRYTREDLLALINSLYSDNYITSLDYALALTLGASRELFSLRVIDKELEAKKIDIKAFNEDINAIVKELETL